MTSFYEQAEGVGNPELPDSMCCFGFSVSSGEKQHKNGEAEHTHFLRCVYNRIIQKTKDTQEQLPVSDV